METINTCAERKFLSFVNRFYIIIIFIFFWLLALDLMWLWWVSHVSLQIGHWAPCSTICHFHRGHQRKYGKYTGMFSLSHSLYLGGVFVSLYCGFTRTSVSSCAFTHSERLNGDFEWRGSGERYDGGGQALVEVVVCAVDRVVILPLVEMTAQSTALLVLVTDDGGVKPDQLRRM